jgi:hypothetical protein
MLAAKLKRAGIGDGYTYKAGLVSIGGTPDSARVVPLLSNHQNPNPDHETVGA